MLLSGKSLKFSFDFWSYTDLSVFSSVILKVGG